MFASSTALHMPLLVGREREHAILGERVTRAIAGNGGLILIGGEAGIGKTSLAEAACRDAEQHGAILLSGRCFDLAETPPYGPWVDAFARYRQTAGLPALPDAFAVRGDIRNVESQSTLFRQVADFVAAVAARQPLVILLDDLHWADPASLDLLRALARSLATLSVCILALYRTEEITPQHPLYALLPMLVREATATRIAIRGLDSDAVRALVAARYGLAHTDTERLATWLQTRGEGNPFFLGELLRSLEETNVLRQDNEAWLLGALREIVVPPLLRQVIGARLGRLDAESQQLLAVAAVVGHEASLAICAAVAARGEGAILECIERAEEVHLIAILPDGTHIRFAHALVREAVYEDIPPSRRRRLHRAVAEALLTTLSPDPDAVAYHFRRAGDARAVEWLIRAADRANRTYALLAAGERYEAALTFQSGIGLDARQRGWLLYCIARARRFVAPQGRIAQLDEALRIAETIGDRFLASRALSQRGQHGVFSGAFAQGITDLSAAIELTEALSESEIATVTSGVVESPMAEYGSLTIHLAHAGRFGESLRVGERFMMGRPANGAHHDGDLAAGYFGLADTYAMIGRVADAARMFEIARTIYREIDHSYIHALCGFIELRWYWLSYFTDDIGGRSRVAHETETLLQLAIGAGFAAPPRFARAPLSLVEGQWSEARADAIALIAETATVAMWRQNAMAILGPIAVAQGDSELAWSLIDMMFPSGPTTAPGDCVFPAASAMQALAAALKIASGDLSAARSWLEAHDRWMMWSGAVVGSAEGLLGWASYNRVAGNAVAAYRHATQALDRATTPRQPLALLAAHRLLGELDTDAGRFEDAAHHLNESLLLASACNAPYERALTLLAMAEAACATGDGCRARTRLDQSRTIFTSLGAAPALRRADALQARLNVNGAPQSLYPDNLSAREVDVLRRIARGMSNREIAAALFISSRTVNRHIENLYRKIAARNRADATAYALRHDLT
jgi:DNA-binding CsgD family transcriptional regulator